MSGPRELLYDIPSIFIALGLLVLMLIAMTIAWLIGRRSHRNQSEEGRSQTTAVQGSMLGLLALLLGFTFSLGLSRHDTRSAAVVQEANAIGTAWLRTDFLPEDMRIEAQADLRRYTRLRLEAAEVSADQHQRRARLITNAEAAFADLWVEASAHAEAKGGPAAVSYAASLNDMIDALGTRDAAIARDRAVHAIWHVHSVGRDAGLFVRPCWDGAGHSRLSDAGADCFTGVHDHRP